jgi:glycine/D-amino acid oxidase-like deaminating enzyme
VKVWTEKTTDTEFKDLGDLGFTGALQDRQFAYLRDQGYTNALADMLAAATIAEETATVPDAFVGGGWSMSTGSGEAELDITLSTLPERRWGDDHRC